ncbi:bacterial transcriptional activator domain-containing protein [Sediminibacterium goheungense]|uniref:Tetratricopeptide repeat protein n=1 Tax=Sediminibacterium goheungense TaxID=1086393 RepID=A0A4R6IX76_9BACT|nr:bacterial transcriptional activator domain-containing protein [Sediminibacterium goheungense]TDO26991.1 tetratricopeptide repeat protein [Sediminibacterium goheungense]
MKQTAILTLLFFLSLSAIGQKVYDFTPTCQQAYYEITRLKIEHGQELIQKARQQNPNNLIPVVLESYIDFLILFLNENPADYKLRYPRFGERIDILDEGPENSPFHRFALSTVRVHKAASAIKFGKMWEAGWDIRRTWILLKDNKKEFPRFVADDLLYGTLQTMIGTIPKGYKWLANVLGMRGSVTEGLKTVQAFINSNDPMAKIYSNEACFIYPYLLFYMDNKKEEAMDFIQQKKLDLVNNHLHGWMAANLSLNNKQSQFTQQIVQNRNSSAEYLDIPIWDFEMGFVKLYQLKPEEAIPYFERFLQKFKGNFYVKDVYDKIRLSYYLEGNTSAAEKARQLVLTKGNTDSDADKKALKDAKANFWPNMLLLKARFLNDGGYHREALTLLHGKTENDFEKEEDRLEYVYRVARIYDDLGRDHEAINAYLAAIRLGEFRKEYYAARAAVQIGQIYEKRGQKSLAVQYYQRCLDMGDHEYKNSLDQRAKSGILRCKGE